MKTILHSFWMLSLATSLHAVTPEPEVAELSFDARWADAELAKEIELPSWIVSVRQEGGVFLDEPRCWKVDATLPQGEGSIEFEVDRSRIVSGNLVATLLFDADENADVAVQLFDSQGRVVVVDLFGNVVDVGMQATTDTFVVPLNKYPTADRIVIRRVSGGMRLHGVVLFPVLTEGPMQQEALQELARVLGDPLSPENPLVSSIQKIAKTSDVKVAAVKPLVKTANPVKGEAQALSYHQAAERFDLQDYPVPSTEGMLVHFGFDDLDATNRGSTQVTGNVRGGAKFVPSERGNVVRLRGRGEAKPRVVRDAITIPLGATAGLHDQLSLSAWVRPSSKRSGGGMLVWHGDRRNGRDPWILHLLGSGQVEFRSDRSVTGRPQFVVRENEIQILPGGEVKKTQHVALKTPHRLSNDRWYFLAATMDMLSARTRTMRLYVNGELVNELQTIEQIDYDTASMWTTIGAVHHGEGQNFTGDMDEVRIYDRALSPAEVRDLYVQPWE